MSEEIELRLLREIEELKQQLNTLKGEDNSGIISYNFSNIKESDLSNIFDIEKKLDDKIFNKWFNNNIDIKIYILEFLKNLIDENKFLIKDYHEEDLKVNVIIPILNLIKFKSYENEFRDFYELQLEYKTDDFILKGTSDFVVSKGLLKSKKPYFFIQEFKKGKVISDPEPQLLAELISAVELNNWKSIRGAYIVGAIWNFVILERLEKHKYQYYVSQNFDSTKIEDLKDIYKNLVFVKNEIIEMIKKEENK
jgi:uncharacterized protein YfkK (UPF0435 family)